ncbi:MAG: hypothetical protein QXI58_00515 [Candidatus Micrarchaeia archaeon]
MIFYNKMEKPGLQLVDPPANWDNLKEYEASGWKYRCEGNVFYLIIPNKPKILKILTEG